MGVTVLWCLVGRMGLYPGLQRIPHMIRVLQRVSQWQTFVPYCHTVMQSGCFSGSTAGNSMVMGICKHTPFSRAPLCSNQRKVGKNGIERKASERQHNCNTSRHEQKLQISSPCDHKLRRV